MTAYDVDELPWSCSCCTESTPIRLCGVELCAACAINLLEARSRWLSRNPDKPRSPWPTTDLRCRRRPCTSARKSAATAAADKELTLFGSPAEESV